MTYKTQWIPSTSELPKIGEKVDWIGPGGDEVTGGEFRGVWILPEGVYLYYTPPFWRPAQQAAKNG